MIDELNDHFAILQAYIADLNAAYLNAHIPGSITEDTKSFVLDVKAYMLLAHAAFEEYTEKISMSVMKKICDDYINKKYTTGTLSLLACYNQAIYIVEEEERSQGRVFDMLRNCFSDAKKHHSSVLINNHGFSVKYLRQMLIPVGIDVPEGIEVDSLHKLARARGTYAHRIPIDTQYGEYGRAHRVMTPEDAKSIADDCLAICQEILKRAIKIVS